MVSPPPLSLFGEVEVFKTTTSILLATEPNKLFIIVYTMVVCRFWRTYLLLLSCQTYLDPLWIILSLVHTYKVCFVPESDHLHNIFLISVGQSFAIFTWFFKTLSWYPPRHLTRALHRNWSVFRDWQNSWENQLTGEQLNLDYCSQGFPFMVLDSCSEIVVVTEQVVDQSLEVYGDRAKTAIRPPRTHLQQTYFFQPGSLPGNLITRGFGEHLLWKA